MRKSQQRGASVETGAQLIAGPSATGSGRAASSSSTAAVAAAAS